MKCCCFCFWTSEQSSYELGVEMNDTQQKKKGFECYKNTYIFLLKKILRNSSQLKRSTALHSLNKSRQCVQSNFPVMKKSVSVTDYITIHTCVRSEPASLIN